MSESLRGGKSVSASSVRERERVSMRTTRKLSE